VTYSYDQRQEALNCLGFQAYTDYLQSDLWKIIRREIYIRDGGRCQGKPCSDLGPKYIHHLGYTASILIGLNPGALVCLCKPHHDFVEFDENGAKLDLPDVGRKTHSLLRRIIAKTARGVSNPAIGRWFRDQHRKNRPVVARIINKLKPTPWYSLLAKLVAEGTVTSSYLKRNPLEM
jgi:hypothetical protein